MAAAASSASRVLRRVGTITTREREHYARFVGHTKFTTPEEEQEWAQTQPKECTKCRKILPRTEFNTNTSGRDAFDKDGYRLLRPECMSCTRLAGAGKTTAMSAAKRMGISYKAPEGTPCACCGKIGDLVFDHDHEREVFRGYLCNSENRALGVLGDNVESLLRYVNYLNRTEKKKIIVDPETGELKCQ